LIIANLHFAIRNLQSSFFQRGSAAKAFEMLRWRLLMSAVLIPAFVGLFWLDHRAGDAAPVLFVLALLLGGRCAWEMVLLLRPRFPELRWTPCAICIAALTVAAWLPHWGVGSAVGLAALGPAAIVWAACVLGLFMYEAWRYTQPGARMETLGAEVLIVSYLGGLLAATVQLRWVAGAQLGYFALGSMVIATKMGDTGAYTFGRLFGKRKMAPHLSPGKTWAGFVGALVGAALGAVLWLRLGMPLFDAVRPLPAWHWCVLFGAIIGLVGLIGDLCESLIKRDMGQKDAAPLMPGFGGLLDLLDSILFAGPVAYILWLLLPL
jgi:phosphatidate cytidylyltransferase